MLRVHFACLFGDALFRVQLSTLHAQPFISTKRTALAPAWRLHAGGTDRVTARPCEGVERNLLGLAMFLFRLLLVLADVILPLLSS